MLVIIPRSGISGDMLLSALIDLGECESKVSGFLRRELSVSIRTETRTVGHARARGLAVAGKGGRYSPSEMREKIRGSSLGEAAKKLALKALGQIIGAEERVHGTKEVHLHELGDADTLVDIMGCAHALELLGEAEVLVLPPNLGRAAPATLEILQANGFPFYSSTDSVELTTPTGAALAVSLARPVGGIPLMVSDRVGCGAGTFDTGDEPNVLRVIRGSEPDRHEEVAILETNIDDVSGEILAHSVERLFEEGARDACLVPIIAKKGRPGVILRAIVDYKKKDALSRVIFEETGTLGIREISCFRHVASRGVVRRKGGKGQMVRVKVGRISGRVISEKPEFEDLKRISKKSGKPLREVSKEFER
jgi:pyridinium-3,5-bisthiocarboxylic acid mononucleotide nickel chelatase